jgi:hypothetical protein
VDAHTGLDAGLLIRAEHVLVLAERLSLPFPLVEVKDAAGLDGEARVAGKIHDLCCHGFSASSASQRRTVDGETAGVMPLATAWRASSGQVQRASGVPFAAGISHARAFTSATTRAGNTRGLPGRGASASPPMPCSQYRRRHLRAVSPQVPSRCAISRFDIPAAASSTIRDRSTRRNGAEARRDRDSSSARSASPRQMT